MIQGVAVLLVLVLVSYQWLVCTENNQLTGNIQCPEYYSCYCCISHHHHLRDTNNIIITVVCLNNKYYINHIPVTVKCSETVKKQTFQAYS